MFKLSQQYTLQQSCSSLYSNLDVYIEEDDSSSDEKRMSFVTSSKTQVSILHCYSNGTTATSQVVTENKINKYNVLQTKWCQLEKQLVLVVTSYNGLLIFDGEGQLLVFWYKFNDADLKDDESIPFCRGIAGVNKQYVCVGTSHGKVMIITPQKNSFYVSQTLDDHTQPISALSSLDEKPTSGQVDFVSADDSGTLCTYRSGQKFSFVAHLGTKSNNLPCTSLQLLPDALIIAGYLNGHIRIFDALNSTLLADISAHVKAVSCLDTTHLSRSGSYIFISGSEDTYIRVWKLSREDDITVTQEWYTYIENLQICGLRFCDASGQSFAVTGYDSTEVKQFIKT